MTKKYTLLTGSKNNAGDFLIKYRAKELFEIVRPDVEIVDCNAWEGFDQKKLNIVNDSDCLILMGGPALQYDMYPGVYKMSDDLNQIRVPITLMGVGWKSKNGRWVDTYNYSLSSSTLRLLNRIASDGLTASVRDYNALNALAFKGFKNCLMTGCPAYYVSEYIDSSLVVPQEFNKIAISLGVSFIESPSMEKQMKDVILNTKEHFLSVNPKCSVEVVFHHSLNPDKYFATHNANKRLNVRHNEFAVWLNKENIPFVDISGSAESLISYYSSVDFHIGYRVHAHIFMNSIRKLSILISEDGRAKGSKSAIGGVVLDGHDGYRGGFISKVLNKMFARFSRYKTNNYIPEEVINSLIYENKSNYLRLQQAQKTLDSNYVNMVSYLEMLP